MNATQLTPGSTVGLHLVVNHATASRILAVMQEENLSPPKPAKKAKPAKEESFDLGPGTGANTDKSLNEMNAEEQAEVEQDVTETMENDDPPLTLAAVTDAFKVYAKKNGRDKALLVLKKFKVKSVQELKPAIYGKVIETLES